MKGRLSVALALGVLLLFTTAATAIAKGDPQGPRKQAWTCILDLRTWHCVPPGRDNDAIVTGVAASAPSVNYACRAADDPVCDGFAVSFGPPASTIFVGTENGIRADLYAGQPCPQAKPTPIDFTGDGIPDYVFCHHYSS